MSQKSKISLFLKMPSTKSKKTFIEKKVGLANEKEHATLIH